MLANKLGLSPNLIKETYGKSGATNLLLSLEYLCDVSGLSLVNRCKLAQAILEWQSTAVPSVRKDAFKHVHTKIFHTLELLLLQQDDPPIANYQYGMLKPAFYLAQALRLQVVTQSLQEMGHSAASLLIELLKVLVASKVSLGNYSSDSEDMGTAIGTRTASVKLLVECIPDAGMTSKGNQLY